MTFNRDSAGSALPAATDDSEPAVTLFGARDRTDEALLRLFRVMVGTTVRIGNAMLPNLSAMQVRTLTVLSANASGVSLGGVAESLGATTSATSRVCARLVRDGLVDRAAGPGNEIRLTLSESGQDALTRLNRARLEHITPLLTAVPDADREGVASALRTLADIVDRTGSVW